MRGEGRMADQNQQFVDDRTSKRILTQARQQLQELEEETSNAPRQSRQIHFANKKPADSDDDDEDDDEDEQDEDNGALELDPRKMAAEMDMPMREDPNFDQFVKTTDEPRKTIADLILEKLEERKTEVNTRMTDAESMRKAELDPRVVEMYEGVGKVLERYRSGKVPKAFKVIPQFRNWEELALLTRPDKWSAAAVFRATRIFVSGLNEKMAQRFFNLLLLPRIRDDIDTYQRLNFHLYQAMRKALFKPGAFFKGFLIPLCESGDCSLREATIIGSVLAKCSIPVLHSCAVLLKIAEMEYSGANSIFIRVFLDKKYALPYRVVDAVVFHFLGFRNETRELPVLWHQAFLTFIQVNILMLLIADPI